MCDWHLILTNADADTKVIVLKAVLDEGSAGPIIDAKKAGVFKTRLRRPRRDEVHVHSTSLLYEAVLLVSAKYRADFFRKAIHPIKVDYNVSEVVMGEGVFPIRSKSAIARALSGRRAKNRVDLKLEEHVFIETEESVYFDHHGKEVDFAFKINSNTVENYPQRILRDCKPNVIKPGITKKVALDLLGKKLRGPPKSGVRDLCDELSVSEIAEIYVPVFETRLIGPKKKVGIMRIDAVGKKIL